MNDLELLRKYADTRDRTALETLFKRHMDTLYAMAMRICRHPEDANDALQAAMITIMEKAHRFKGNHDKGVLIWMTKIVITTCKMKIRSEVRRRRREKTVMEERDTAIMDPPESGEERKKLAKTVFGLINSLPEQYRLAIWLHHYQGMSLKDASSVLSIKQNTLHVQLNRGMKKLRDLLQSKGISASSASILALFPILPAEKAPQHLMESVPNIISAGPRSSRTAASALRPKPASGILPLKNVLVSFVLIASGISVYMGFFSEPAPTTAAAPVVPPPLTENRTFRSWDFNTAELPPAFRVMEGSAAPSLHNGINDTPCLETRMAVLRIKFPIKKFPILVTFKTSLINLKRKGGYVVSAQFLPSAEVAPFYNTSQVNLLRFKKGQKHTLWIKHRSFITEQWISRWSESEFHDIIFHKPVKNSRVTLMLEGHLLLDDLVIQEIDPRKLPDMRLYVKAYQQIPPERRFGKVFLPQLKPGKNPLNGKQVFVRFFESPSAAGKAQVLTSPDTEEILTNYLSRETSCQKTNTALHQFIKILFFLYLRIN